MASLTIAEINCFRTGLAPRDAFPKAKNLSISWMASLVDRIDKSSPYQTASRDAIGLTFEIRSSRFSPRPFEPTILFVFLLFIFFSVKFSGCLLNRSTFKKDCKKV